MAAPVRKDEEIEVQVDSLAYGGNGVARLNGFVVFVRRGLPGDRVRARVTKVKRGFAEALAVDVLEPSPHRVEAPCAHYPSCGGCRFQDLAYEVQAASKEEQVRDALKRIGGIADAPVEPILPAESQFFYRNKLEYSFAQTPSGPALGFHRAGRWDEVLEIEKCWLTTDLGNAIRNAVRDWAREENLEAYDQAEHTGYLRHLVYREGRNTGQVLIVLVTAPGEKFERDYFVEVLRRFPEVKSIHWVINDQPSEVTNLPSTLLWGDDAIEEELLGRRFRVRPNAFLQTNTGMAEKLYALAIEYAGLTGTETVYDLYCGTGTIGLSMANHALSVWGVDISEESIACALENLDLNQIGNAAFFAGNVGQVLEELAERAGPADVVVVDPPRAGLAGKALRRTGELGAPKLVYISCNPTTLASDVKVLREQYGYELVRTKPVDMFPHTPHVETVSLLTRRERDRDGAALAAFAVAVLSGGNAVGVRVSNRELDRTGEQGFGFCSQRVSSARWSRCDSRCRGAVPLGSVLYGALIFGFGFSLTTTRSSGSTRARSDDPRSRPLATCCSRSCSGRSAAPPRRRGAASIAGIGVISGVSGRDRCRCCRCCALAVLCFAEGTVLVRRFPPVHPVTTALGGREPRTRSSDPDVAVLPRPGSTTSRSALHSPRRAARLAGVYVGARASGG